MQNVGNSFGLPFRSPGYFGTLVLMGLIGLIPIVGWINSLGWMLSIVDNYRSGRTDLPPAGFQYIGRGATLFLVVLVYALIIGAIFAVPFFLILAGSIASASASSATPGSTAFFGGGFATYIGLIQLLSLAISLFYPAVIVATERGGAGGGLNPVNVFGIAAANWKNTFIAGLLFFAASFIGGLGIYACCIGILFTAPYSTAVMAGVVRYYEAEFEIPPIAPQAGVPPPPPPPAPYPPT